MATYTPGATWSEIVLGLPVYKPTVTLPATATSTLFTVAGGRCLVTGLVGTVSTACGATVTSVSLGLAPSVGTTSSTSLASATAVTSKEAGTMIGLGSTAGAALVVGTNASTPLIFASPQLVVTTGTITWTTSATDTGAVSWLLTYVPLDVGASIS